jgi:dethiobiotin synthetase
MIFISATDTDVGKTYFANKIIGQLLKSGRYTALELAYYKPIQCGSEKDYDLIKEEHPGVATYISYDFAFAASPDYAASLENIDIQLEKIQEDFTKIKAKHKFIIVEGAGGLAVPINDTNTVADIVKILDLPLVLIIRSELGTINHSILSIEYARHKGLKLNGIIVSTKNKNNDQAVQARNDAAIASILKHAKVNLIKLEFLPWI